MTPTLKSLEKEFFALKNKVDVLSSLLPDPTKPSRFVDNGDGTVTDKEMNLTWMKKDDGKERTWEEAKEYCEKLRVPGKDWRLPTMKELFSLVDHEKYSPCIDPVFTDTKTSYYWTSTPYAGGSSGAWFVDFDGGNVFWGGVNSERYVRPVRQNS